MATFDRPVVAVKRQDALGVGAVGCMAGDAIGQFPRFFAGFLADHMAFDNKRLTDAGEAEVIVELRCRPDGARLDATVGQCRFFTEVRRPTLGKSQREIVEQLGLITFDGEQVMRSSLADVTSQMALRQQRIGGQRLAGQVDFKRID